MDDDDYYGPNHLTDLITALHYSQADIVGCGGERIYLAELGLTVFRDARTNERYMERVGGATMLMPLHLAKRLRFNRANTRIDSLLFERAVPHICRIYSTHPFGFIIHRHGEGHTWDAPPEYFMRHAIAVVPGIASNDIPPVDDPHGGMIPEVGGSGDVGGSSADVGGVVARLVDELAVVSARAVAAERALDGAFGSVEGGVDRGGRRLWRRLAERIVEAESRAADAEYRLARLEGRRASRVGIAVGGSLHPRQWLRLPGRLRAALQRGAAPKKPARVNVKSVLGEIAAVGDVLFRGFEKDYPYLRVGHWGPVVSFESVVPHRRVASVGDVDELVDSGADLVVIEPVRGHAPPGFVSDSVGRFVEAGIPVVLYARTVDDLELDVAGACSTIVTDDAGVAGVARERFGDRVVAVVPFVDDTVYNPVGWQRFPEEMSAVVFAPVTKGASSHPALDGLIQGASVYRIGDEPVADVGGFVEVAKRHLVAVVDPTHWVSETSFLEQLVRLVACGTPVITAPSPHLDVVFPAEGLVTVVESVEDAEAAVERLSADLVERERGSIRARQFVLQHHTARHRFDVLLDRHGIPVRPDPSVSILLVTKRPDYLEHAVEQIRSQRYESKELIMVLHGDDFDLEEIAGLTARCDFPTITIQQPASATFGDCLNVGIDHASGQLLTKMDDDDYYGPNHLTDLITALHYSQADIVGKRTNFTIFEDLDVAGLWNGDWTEIESSHLPGATMLARKELFDTYRFARLRRGVDSDLLQRTRDAGALTYSTHPYNFVRVRHDDHTFTRSDAEFFQKTINLTREFSPEDAFA
jgi:hypothetical protein